MFKRWEKFFYSCIRLKWDRKFVNVRDDLTQSAIYFFIYIFRAFRLFVGGLKVNLMLWDSF